jgi:hypothetical protein
VDEDRGDRRFGEAGADGGGLTVAPSPRRRGDGTGWGEVVSDEGGKVMAEEVNSPEHYTSGGIEVIDYLKAKMTPEEYRGFLRGNALKYLSRAGLKGSPLTDFRKALWYLEQLVNEAAR